MPGSMPVAARICGSPALPQRSRCDPVALSHNAEAAASSGDSQIGKID
jgi:hypothetical protein